MKRGMKGNIEFNEYYDEESDIYYVTFKTGEPSHVIELNDILLLEVGMFSALPTGFRILNYSKQKGISFNIKEIRKEVGNITKERSIPPSNRADQFEAALKELLPS